MRCALSVVAMSAGPIGCLEYPLLDTKSSDARAIADYFWLLLVVTGVPACLTIVALLVGAVGNASARPDAAEERRRLWLIFVLGGALPLAIVVVLLVESVRLGNRVTQSGPPDALTIDVIGRQFWWEVRYPEEDIVTANEVHIPVGERVRLRLASGDVIHSFWVPELGGKRDMVPGQINELWIHAEEEGVYRGYCAEFCGAQHALMLLELIAQPPAAFARWVDRHRRAVTPPASNQARRGLKVFQEAACGHCHTIRGVTPELAMGAMGPDLTHFASRRRLGAGFLPNNRGNLGGWLLNPQALKPGNAMPNTTFDPADFHALVDFLETLH